MMVVLKPRTKIQRSDGLYQSKNQYIDKK